MTISSDPFENGSQMFFFSKHSPLGLDNNSISIYIYTLYYGSNTITGADRGHSSLVLSKDPVLRYQVGTKKMKMSWYQVCSSTGGTEYPVNPVLDAYSPVISAMQKTRTESRNPVIKKEFTV